MEPAKATIAACQFHQHHRYQNSKCIKMFWGLTILLLLTLSNQSAASDANIVKSLPGFPGELPFLLETGYIDVGEVDEVELFYYFIESEGEPEDNPLVLWLTGGPGCSALYGLMYEIGPLSFDYGRSSGGKKPVLTLNDYSWTKVANIIFLDAPVGTGFSYAKTSSGYNTNDTKSAADIYMFLRKWLVAHPRFRANPLYIAGDSYSGITVPVLVKEISDGNKAGTLPPINLRGYILGNPLTDIGYDINSRVKFSHRVGLLSDELYLALELSCKGEYVRPNKSEGACISNLEIMDLCLKDIFAPMILERKCSPFSSAKPNNILKWGSTTTPSSDTLLLELRRCRGTIKTWEMCSKNLAYVNDITSSVEYHLNFTSEDLRAIIYSGDHDLIVPYVGTEEWIQSLNLTVSSDDVWSPWFQDGQVAGYTEIYTKNKYVMTFATVKGGGHTAAEYKPKESFNMISRWLSYYYL
ncbi:serine carboxypeptidase-like 1 isoform X2 [Arachis ipaensis]|uniref:serine carboxypeptidase-like 1 isoform X2 n=1 Tax=Arachis ipaensis TaxID=130454 RepID=UPI0007AF0927|nr:serine carboxypeptidase-like 1 isoform X2 [Arachis ipaensis]